MRRRKHAFAFVSLLLCMFVLHTAMAQNNPFPRRDINAVLAAHDRELLALPDVVGVGVSVLPDHITPCLRVMLARNNFKTKRAIPRFIEGYPVMIEVTGEIRALGGR
jgi:hypothetical protein